MPHTRVIHYDNHIACINSRAFAEMCNCTRYAKCVSKYTNLLGLVHYFSKLSKELYVGFFLGKPWIVPAALAQKLEASSITTFFRKCKNVRRKFFEKRYLLYLAWNYPKIAENIFYILLPFIQTVWQIVIILFAFVVKIYPLSIDV